MNELQIANEITLAQDTFKNSADYVIIVDSLSSQESGDKDTKRVCLVHEFPEIEILVAVPKDNIESFPFDLFKGKTSDEAIKAFRGLSSPEVNLIEAEGTLKKGCEPSLDSIPDNNSATRHRFIYYIVESSNFNAFCQLNPNSFLSWFQRGRSAIQKEAYGFNGEKMLIPLEQKEFTFRLPVLNGGRYFGNLRTSMLLDPIVIHEKENGLVSKLRQQTWQAAIRKMKEEYGSPIPNGIGVIKAFDAYQRMNNQFPKRAVDYLTAKTQETLRELEQIQF